MAGYETQVKEESALFFEHAARSGDTVGSSGRPCRRNSGFLLRLERNQGGSFMAPGGQVVSDRKQPRQSVGCSEAATDNTTATVGQAGSPK